jgi:hypothetical protein
MNGGFYIYESLEASIVSDIFNVVFPIVKWAQAYITNPALGHKN